jgi:FtsZ-interacting cell division protein YlmF
MDLRAMPEEDAKRLVDFSAGTILHARGSIMWITDRVFFLEQPDPPDDPEPVPTKVPVPA